MLQGLVTAFRTLTIFPVPGREADNRTGALPFFPVVGCTLGLILWALSLSDKIIDGGWPSGVAVLMLFTGVICTRALHLDGLADCADAVGGGWSRAKRLEIMKDTSLGAFGAVALILALLIKWVAFTRLVATGTSGWVILILTISRAMQVELAVRLPYARDERGTAAPFVEDATGRQRAAAFSATLLLAAAYGPLGLLALALAEGITLIYGAWCRHYLGGITGDLLGAGNEIVEISLLFVSAGLSSQLSALTGWEWLFS